jgi:hypothetical protein
MPYRSVFGDPGLMPGYNEYGPWLRSAFAGIYPPYSPPPARTLDMGPISIFDWLNSLNSPYWPLPPFGLPKNLGTTRSIGETLAGPPSLAEVSWPPVNVGEYPELPPPPTPPAAGIPIMPPIGNTWEGPAGPPPTFNWRNVPALGGGLFASRNRRTW